MRETVLHGDPGASESMIRADNANTQARPLCMHLAVHIGWLGTHMGNVARIGDQADTGPAILVKSGTLAGSDTPNIHVCTAEEPIGKREMCIA